MREWSRRTERAQPTRLETRTKESDTDASTRVFKPACAMKVKGVPRQPTLIFCEGFESSITVGTRKMVNYA